MKKRAAGVWACGDRKTVRTEQFERTLESGAIEVLSLEKIQTLRMTQGFLRGDMTPRVVPLVTAEKYGGGRTMYTVSQSFSVPGDILPVTGKMASYFKAETITKQRARLRRLGFIKTKTTTVKSGQFQTAYHVPIAETPLFKRKIKPGARLVA